MKRYILCCSQKGQKYLKPSPDADPENDHFWFTESPMVHGCKETGLCFPGKTVKVEVLKVPFA